MTGEITLRGKVLPIGGVKEKLLAAHRIGVTTIILPRENEKDLADVPKNVLEVLTVELVGHIDEVLKIALVPPAPAQPQEAAEPPEGARRPAGRDDPLTPGGPCPGAAACDVLLAYGAREHDSFAPCARRPCPLPGAPRPRPSSRATACPRWRSSAARTWARAAC